MGHRRLRQQEGLRSARRPRRTVSAPKTVIRTGYGITMDPGQHAQPAQRFPSVINQDFTPPNSYQFISYRALPKRSARDAGSLPTVPRRRSPTSRSAPSSRRPTASPTTYLPTTGDRRTFPQNMNRGYIPELEFLHPARILADTVGGSGIRRHARRPHHDGRQHQRLGAEHGQCRPPAVSRTSRAT